MITTADLLARVRIKAMLIGDPELVRLDIGVDVRDGFAVLTGKVDTSEQRQAVEDIAAEVPDVLAVKNDLGISSKGSEAAQAS